MVSNALDRPKEMPKVDSFLSIAEEILLIKSIEADTVELLLRNPNFSSIRYYASLKIQSVSRT